MLFKNKNRAACVENSAHTVGTIISCSKLQLQKCEFYNYAVCFLVVTLKCVCKVGKCNLQANQEKFFAKKNKQICIFSTSALKTGFSKVPFLEDFLIMTNLKSVQKCVHFSNCAACVIVEKCYAYRQNRHKLQFLGV